MAYIDTLLGAQAKQVFITQNLLSPGHNWLVPQLTAENNMVGVPRQMLVWKLAFDLTVSGDSYRAGDGKPTHPLFEVLCLPCKKYCTAGVVKIDSQG